MVDAADVLDGHLNVSWLRPENAVFDSAATMAVRANAFASPMLDLGCGNGIFSFLTAGGRFTLDFDWFLSTTLDGAADIYDAPVRSAAANAIARGPEYRIDVALDHKANLLAQAADLGLYGRLVQHDASQPLPFAGDEFASIFSNILYWLPSPEDALREVARVLRPGGRAVFCLPDSQFRQLATSYRWRELDAPIWRLLNAGRADSMKWTIGRADFERMAERCGLRPVAHRGYLSPLTIRVWDIGLRLLSRPLIRLANGVPPDQRRLAKQEWMDAARPVLRELLEAEVASREVHAFHCFTLERR